MDSEADQISSGKDADAAEAKPDRLTGVARAAAVLLLVSLLAVATAVYWQDLVPPMDLDKDEEAPISSVPPVVASDTTVASSPEPTTTRLDLLQRQVQRLRDDVDNISVSTNLFWALSEVEYLLTTASYKLSIEGDVNAALQLLGHADTRLENIQVQELQEVRSHIGDAMSALRALPVYSVPELMAMLDNLADMIFHAAAPATAAAEPQEQHAESAAASDDGHSWWSVAWRDVRSMIRVEKISAVAGDADAAGRPRHAKQELRWLWRALRGAALRRDDESFQAALAGLRKELASSGDIAPPLARELGSLAEVRLRPTVDDASLHSAVETLRAYQRGGQ